MTFLDYHYYRAHFSAKPSKVPRNLGYYLTSCVVQPEGPRKEATIDTRELTERHWFGLGLSVTSQRQDTFWRIAQKQIISTAVGMPSLLHFRKCVEDWFSVGCVFVSFSQPLNIHAGV